MNTIKQDIDNDLYYPMDRLARID